MDHNEGMIDDEQYEEGYPDEMHGHDEEGMMDENFDDLPVTQEDAWAVIR